MERRNGTINPKVIFLVAVVAIVLFFIIVSGKKKSTSPSEETGEEVAETTQVETGPVEENVQSNFVFEPVKDTVEVGEAIELNIIPDDNGYIYLFSADNRGAIRQIFPNDISKNNRVLASNPVKLGDFEIFGESPGRETIYLLFSRIDIGDFDPPLSQIVKRIGQKMEGEEAIYEFRVLKTTVYVVPKAGRA